MREYWFLILLCLCLILMCTCIGTKSGQSDDLGLADCFYDQKSTYPFLDKLQSEWKVIREEMVNLDDNWKDWPEEYFKDDGKWTVFPFYGFGHWAEENCKKCPQTWKMLRSIPGLKTAGFSRLGPGTVLKPHQGWADLSNNVLRCHLPLIVPQEMGKRCGIQVDNTFVAHREGEWMVFDDSKMHSGINETSADRTILLIDIERPLDIPKGISTVRHSKELDDFVTELKRM